MYTGYLIYHDYEAKKNSAFIELFKKYGKLKGIDFMYIPYSDYKEKTLPDIVINRTRDASVSLWYEKKNVIDKISLNPVKTYSPKYNPLYITFEDENGIIKPSLYTYIESSADDKTVPEYYNIYNPNASILDNHINSKNNYYCKLKLNKCNSRNYNEENNSLSLSNSVPVHIASVESVIYIQSKHLSCFFWSAGCQCQVLVK